MVIHLSSELEAALKKSAGQENITPELLALSVLRERFLVAKTMTPRDEWERSLLNAASDCGVSLPHSALSRENLYD